MTCAHYRHLISRYLDGEVTPRQRKELLEHVEGCLQCSAWLARARQTDVLLKGGVPEARPSDRVRDAILSSVKHQPVTSARSSQLSTGRRPQSKHSAFRKLSLLAAGLLLRFDPSPRRVALVAATSMFALVGLAYWLNILPPMGGYKELGFIVPGEEAPVAVNATPLAAVSSGEFGVGGVVAVPNMVRQVPADSARDVSLSSPMSIRFDQPMDRASVEKSWVIDPPAAGTFNWDADNEVRFAAYEPGLLRGITYTVLLSNTARSLTGTPLRQPISWSFHTKDPYKVMPGTNPDATLSPTDTLTLSFETPMNREQTSISLRAAASGADLPVALNWDPEGRKVTVSPSVPMPTGTVYLRAGAMSRTEAGDTLGQPHEFSYKVTLPEERLRLLDGRINLVSAGVTSMFSYDVGDSIGSAPVISPTGHIPDEDPGNGPAVTFSLYNLPAEYLSALDTGKRPWPLSLPQGLPLDTIPVQTFWSNLSGANSQEGKASLPDTIKAGTYVLVCSRLTRDGIVNDWQLLVMSDRHLALTGDGGGAPFWATDEQGYPWRGSEISLYSSEGNLLQKGLTDDHGLWTPDIPKTSATLAIARDWAGHLAAMLIDPTASPEPISEPVGSLSARLRTDRAEYYPGQPVNFHVLLSTVSRATPVAEQEVSIALLALSGDALSSLTLKLDDTGGASGLFNLPADLRPGVYTLLVQSGGAERRFPLHVKQARGDTLSVYIVPGQPEDASTRVVKRTVSVLGPRGVAAAGATLTMTLGIAGDAWVSKPLTTTINADGKSTVTLTLPDWIAMYNDPGLFITAEASGDGMWGTDSQYLDLTSAGVALAGMKQVVSPSLNLAAVAQPTADGVINVRVVTLDSAKDEGDVLLTARSPSGEHGIWSLDLPNAGDLTVILPPQYAGGRVRLQRSGVAGTREMALMPAESGDLQLQVGAPFTATPGGPLTTTIGLLDKDGHNLEGAASVWFRRVASNGVSDSGDVRGELRGWEPDIALSSLGSMTSTVQAPGTPGLWYMISEAATGDGGYAQTWSVVRVLPGPSIQLPPTLQADAMQSQALSVVVHNPGSAELSSIVTLSGDNGLSILDSTSQFLTIASGDSQRVDWRLQVSRPGSETATFAFTSGREATGSWSLGVVASESTETNNTYLAGMTSNEKSVGILVPSDLSPEHLELQVRASTSLLPTLSSIVTNLTSDSSSGAEKASAAAARLGSAAALSPAYTQVGAQAPSDLLPAANEMAHLLQEIYAAQHKDGSWSAGDSVPDATLGSITGTAHILLALHRYDLALSQGGAGEAQLRTDSSVLARGLAYLTSEVERPVDDSPSKALLDERAYGLYALSSFGLLQAEVVRPYIVYTSVKSEEMSRAGEAWLAIALMQSGSVPDGLLLVDRLLKNGQESEAEASAPILEALLLADKVSSQKERVSQVRETSAYANAVPLYVRLLMEARQGLGWGTFDATTDALWSLSRYAGQESDKVTMSLPDLTLNDRPVQVSMSSDSSDNGTLSLIIPGSEMHAGTNWLKLKTLVTGQSLYYSLTLKATK